MKNPTRRILAVLLAALLSFFAAACAKEEYAVVTEDYSIHFAKTRRR